MTIKRYLFLLFSTLILTVAITQVVMLYVFKSKIEEEVDRRGKNFADMIVNFAVDNFEAGENSTNSDEDVVIIQQKKPITIPQVVLIEVEQEFSNKEIETTFELPIELLSKTNQLEQAIVELPEDAQTLILKLASKFNRTNARRVRGVSDNFKVKIFKPHHSHKHSVRKKLMAQINKFQVNKDVTHETKQIVSNKGKIKQTWITKLDEQRKAGRDGFLNYLFNGVILLIIITTAIALIMVFWLSKKFSHPLQALSQGFKKLEQGEFGVNVKPSGVTEIKNTIESFNYMSSQLVKLAEAEHKLVQQNHLTELSDVSKGIAHALRNPMHTIGLAIEQLSQPDLPDELKQKLIAKVQNKIAQLDKNIKALLTVTSGEIERSDHVNLSLIINDISLELKQSNHLSGSHLNLDIDVDDDLHFVGSDKEIRTILHTLIFNAYEAGMAFKPDDIYIKVSADKTENGIKVVVEDKSGGIKEDIMKRIFEPHNSSKAEGAGMGLYIGKRITELYYNGSLSINNRTEAEKTIGAIAELNINKSQPKD